MSEILTAEIFDGCNGPGLWAETDTRAAGTEEDDDPGIYVLLYTVHPDGGYDMIQALEDDGETMLFKTHADAIDAASDWLGVLDVTAPEGWEEPAQ